MYGCVRIVCRNNIILLVFHIFTILFDSNKRIVFNKKNCLNTNRFFIRNYSCKGDYHIIFYYYYLILIVFKNI